jgi:hypothetical protein
MNRYILIRRLRGPAYLLLVGFIALMAQAHIMSWGHSWPLFLILAGVLALAERAALATEGDPPPPYAGSPYPGGPYQGAPYAGGPNPPGTAPSAPTAPSTSIVPAHTDDFERGSDGGQS